MDRRILKKKHLPDPRGVHWEADQRILLHPRKTMLTKINSTHLKAKHYKIMEPFQVRPYTSADYPALCRLDAVLFEGMGGHVLFRHIEELFRDLFFVAETIGTQEIVGYILGGVHFDDPKIGKLIRIGVKSDFRRIEAGTQLTSALFCEMRKHGVKKVHLTVADTNSAAVSFYLKNGFLIKNRVDKYFYPDISRLILEKDL